MDATARTSQHDAKNAQTTLLARTIAARLEGDSHQLIDRWRNPEGTRTRHFIVDDLLPAEMAAKVQSAFPRESSVWVRYETFRERKSTFAKLGEIEPLIGEITDAFHLADVLAAITKITAIEGLEADPELYAGGISMMGKGDFLNPHIDNSHDAGRHRYRRLNLLYYVSPDWRLDYGGNFELWDDHVRRPKVILSKCNRLVVMETTKQSWHSVNPVVVDGDRCCISNYYFSRNSPEKNHYYHVTSFTGRPGQSLARLWGRADNFMRQWIAIATKTSRGKSLSRYN